MSDPNQSGPCFVNNTGLPLFDRFAFGRLAIVGLFVLVQDFESRREGGWTAGKVVGEVRKKCEHVRVTSPTSFYSEQPAPLPTSLTTSATVHRP